MSEVIKKEEMDMELNPNKLEQVSGGVAPLEQLINRIYADGYAEALKTILN